MPDEIATLIARLRAGDARAAEELFQHYEPVIRMEVRRHMRDPRLRRAFDSLDVCQSVMASFFVRASLGQYDLDDGGGVVKLLVGMAHNKLAEQVRKQRRQCRDYRRAQPLGEEARQTPASDPTPSAIIVGEELLQAARQELSEKERQLADRRLHGQKWEQIATKMGGTAQARKKQLERAVARVAQRLGLNETEPS
jgi:RNA polymerase sigma-70 factor (ECF subfamily)